MDVGILDIVTTAFLGALASGQGALARYSIVLLGVFAIIAYYLESGALVASGHAGLGDALGNLLFTVMKAGFFYWLLVNLAPLANAAYLTFLQWGLAPTGGGISAQTFLAPSKILLVGFRAAAPLHQFVQSFTGPSALWNLPVLLTYDLAYWVIVLSFAFVVLHLMMTIIEFNLAVLVGTVLIPFGVLQPTAFFTEFSIGWLTGGLVRILVTTAMVGIAVPLFDLVTFTTTAGGDPTFYGAMVAALTSGIFAILSWIIPGRAAAIAGSGVSLAVHGGTLLSGAASAARGTLIANAAIRGVSRMIKR